MALGSPDLPPLSMARAYAVFANGGYLVDPYYIRQVADSQGVILYAAQPRAVCPDCERPTDLLDDEAPLDDRQRPVYRPLQGAEPGDAPPSFGTGSATDSGIVTEPAPRVISEQNAYLVRSMMMDVIRRGTGKAALELGRQDLAGKTGTTNDQRDAWFSGYNEALVTTVWVGFDNHEPLGRAEVGGRAALPIWIQFMGVALQGAPDEPPHMPTGIVQAKIDPDTGLIAALANPEAIMEIFESGRLPDLESELKGNDPNAAEEEDPYDSY
jgi:penicillin-binding protein 1A